MQKPRLKLRCPECGSLDVRTNKTSSITICRHCGHEAPRSKFEEKEEEK